MDGLTKTRTDPELMTMTLLSSTSSKWLASLLCAACLLASASSSVMAETVDMDSPHWDASPDSDSSPDWDYGQPDYGQPDYGQPDYGRPDDDASPDWDGGQPNYDAYPDWDGGQPTYDASPDWDHGYANVDMSASGGWDQGNNFGCDTFVPDEELCAEVDSGSISFCTNLTEGELRDECANWRAGKGDDGWMLKDEMGEGSGQSSACMMSGQRSPGVPAGGFLLMAGLILGGLVRRRKGA